MSHKIGGSFTRRGPDVLTEELAVILSGDTSFEFKPLFILVYANLRARNLASGGEEMCRLRVYEKLHAAGVKTYSGLASLASALPVLPVTKVVG